jgi:replicative DNA helicase
MIPSVSEIPDSMAKRHNRAMRARLNERLDRLPPHSTEAERGVLGCCLIDPNNRVGECITKLKEDGKLAFYDLRHQEIYETLTKMFFERGAMDLITVQQDLKDRQMLEQVGGIAYLCELQDSVPSAANLSYYLDIVQEKYLLRRAISVCTDFVGKAYDADDSPEQVIDRLEQQVMKLRLTKSSGTTPIRDLVHEAIGDIEKMFQNKGQITGLTTGLDDLDTETNGLNPAEFILIAAFPSVGKTSLAMNIVEHVAIDLGLPVGVFSAEMTAKALVMRSLCSRGRVNLRHVRDGFLAESDFPKLTMAAGKLAQTKLHIDDEGDTTIQQVRAKARRMVQQHGVKLIVADYAQLFSSPGAEGRTDEVTQVSHGFKAMAKELGVPVILLSQLTEDAKGGIHLKGARALGEDADGYWMLKRPKGSVDDPSQMSEPIELWLKKQRNGTRNVCINLTFIKPFTRFEMQARQPIDDDVPGYMPD